VDKAVHNASRIFKRYGITLSAKAEENRQYFASVRALTLMIESQRTVEGESK